MNCVKEGKKRSLLKRIFNAFRRGRWSRLSLPPDCRSLLVEKIEKSFSFQPFDDRIIKKLFERYVRSPGPIQHDPDRRWVYLRHRDNVLQERIIVFIEEIFGASAHIFP